MALAPNILANRQANLSKFTQGRTFNDPDMAGIVKKMQSGVGTMGSADWSNALKSLMSGHGSTGSPGAAAFGYNGTGQAKYFPVGANGLPDMSTGGASGMVPGHPVAANPLTAGYRPGATTGAAPAAGGMATMAAGAPGAIPGAYPGGTLQDNLRNELWQRLQTDQFGLGEADQQAFLSRGIGQGMEAFTEDAKRRGIYRSNLQMPEQQRMVEGVNADLTQFNAGLAQQQREALRNQLLGIVGEEAATGRTQMQETGANTRTQMQESGATARNAAQVGVQRYGIDTGAKTAAQALAEQGRQYNYDYGLRQNDQQFGQGLSTRYQTDAEQRWRAELAARVMQDSERNTMGAYGAF